MGISSALPGVGRSVLEDLEKSLEEAAASLGATSLQIFRRAIAKHDFRGKSLLITVIDLPFPVPVESLTAPPPVPRAVHGAN